MNIAINVSGNFRHGDLVHRVNRADIRRPSLDDKPNCVVSFFCGERAVYESIDVANADRTDEKLTCLGCMGAIDDYRWPVD